MELSANELIEDAVEILGDAGADAPDTEPETEESGALSKLRLWSSLSAKIKNENEKLNEGFQTKLTVVESEIEILT